MSSRAVAKALPSADPETSPCAQDWRWRFGTKAEVLWFLAGRLRTARLLPQIFFSVGQWRCDPSAILEALQREPWFEGSSFAVRSSSGGEDNAVTSGAGRFDSVLGVAPDGLPAAIEQVILSYGEPKGTDQVLIQPMVGGLRISGVATSYEVGTGRPYAVVSWSEEGDPRAVTSGATDRGTTWYWSRLSPTPPPASDAMGKVIELLLELETLLAHPALDIEFAVGDEGLFLLQARPIVGIDVTSVSAAPLQVELERASELVRKLQAPHPHALGSTTYFSVMTDWNPAEMIGRRPRPLASSLYRELITDQIWAQQREAYGYRDMRGFPLLVTFAGQPFIDVRASLNSFVPADLPRGLASRLVEHYLERLREEPDLHDKVEFEIVLSANAFDLPARVAELAKIGFTEEECALVRRSLQALTNRIIASDGPWYEDLARIEQLPEKRRRILDSDLPVAAKIHWLLEDCKRYGTRPFAGLARAAFIAVQLLRSMVTAGLASRQQVDDFFTQLDTVSGDIIRDRVSLPIDEFLQRHGHLRPGTYEILSRRYDEAFDEYFGDPSLREPAAADRERRSPFSSPDDQERISRALKEQGFEIDAVELERFARRAIQAREHSKWEFTKSLSAALVLIEELGQEHGLSRDDCSYLTASDVLRLYSGSEGASAFSRFAVARAREHYERTCRVALPHLIFGSEAVWEFSLPASVPTFVTSGIVAGPPALEPANHASLAGRIVLIQSADPGYDWIFCHEIAGFVTAYGGANSHMAIRAAELAIPALIGVGEERLQELARASRLQIDCLNHTVQCQA